MKIEIDATDIDGSNAGKLKISDDEAEGAYLTLQHDEACFTVALRDLIAAVGAFERRYDLYNGIYSDADVLLDELSKKIRQLNRGE